MTVPSHIQSAVADLKRLVSKCTTEEQRLSVARFGLTVFLRSPSDLLALLSERPQWLSDLGVSLVPSKAVDLSLDELIELRRST